MAKNLSVKGVWTAVITPFNDDLSIDYGSFAGMVSSQLEAGVQGLVIAGTTGESPTLSIQEKLSLIKKAKVLSGGKLQIMAGTGGSCTDQCVELAKLCIEAGANSLLVVTPPYNKPNTSGMFGHFNKLSQASTVPICLYHVPSRTAQHLSCDEIVSICELPNVSMIKEASSNLNFLSQLVQNSTASILTGDDPTFLPSLAVGGCGAISVVSNIFPKAMVQLQNYFNLGQVEKAQLLHNVLHSFVNLLFVETNPCPLKAALSVAGVCKNNFRLPLGPVSDENFSLIKRVYLETKEKLLELGAHNEGK